MSKIINRYIAVSEITILCLVFGFNPTYAQEKKCYDKYIVPATYDSVEHTIIRYTGSDYYNPYVKNRTIMSPLKKQTWVKKLVDRNCNAPNPNDCLVWCLDVTPIDSINYIEVMDTIQIKEFEIQKIKLKGKLLKDESYGKIEILCPDIINADLIRSIESQLMQNGYDIEFSNKKKLYNELNQAIYDFQKDVSLPQSKLTKLTLEKLGINMN